MPDSRCLTSLVSPSSTAAVFLLSRCFVSLGVLASASSRSYPGHAYLQRHPLCALLSSFPLLRASHLDRVSPIFAPSISSFACRLLRTGRRCASVLCRSPARVFAVCDPRSLAASLPPSSCNFLSPPLQSSHSFAQQLNGNLSFTAILFALNRTGFALFLPLVASRYNVFRDTALTFCLHSREHFILHRPQYLSTPIIFIFFTSFTIYRNGSLKKISCLNSSSRSLRPSDKHDSDTRTTAQHHLYMDSTPCLYELSCL